MKPLNAIIPIPGHARRLAALLLLGLISCTATHAADTPPPVDCDELPTWTAAGYRVGSKVRFGNLSYVARRWTAGSEVPGSNAAWRENGACIPPNGVTARIRLGGYGYLSASVDGAGSTSASSALASWHWNFGDGSAQDAADGAPLTHVYAAPGTYSVTLVVRNSLGVASKTARFPVTVSRAVREVKDGKSIVVFKAADVDAAEQASLARGAPVLASIRASMRTLPDLEVDGVAPGLRSNPDNVQRVEAILSPQTWQWFFPNAQSEATSYASFLKATAKFPGFCRSYPERDPAWSEAVCRKSLATLFAHMVRETGAHSGSTAPESRWRVGLGVLSESGCIGGSCQQYNASCYYSANAPIESIYWPCPLSADGKAIHTYQGRGAHQITYNLNYGALSHLLFHDRAVLLNDPARLTTGYLALASAIGYFVSWAPPKPSMLSLIDGSWQPNARDLEHKFSAGFGYTTAIINDIECFQGTFGGTRESAFSQERISYYRAFARELAVPISAADEATMGCRTMAEVSLATGGSADIGSYWVKLRTAPANLDQYGACKLARDLETPVIGSGRRYFAFYAGIEGDYRRCLEMNGDVEVRH